MTYRYNLWCILFILRSAGLASAQETCSSCYGAGSIATSVILTFILTVLLLGAVYYWWTKYRTKKSHLILESDPEKGKGEYAFDNPGFKDVSLLPTSKALENSKPDGGKSKWNQWSPLIVLSAKSEKRKTMDDTDIEQGNEVKVIALRSHDFTGLGFNICGNMKDGIYIKDILHRGPAFESGKLNPGDRINSVTISFEHMVYEDALTILSYASPYEVIIEAKNSKSIQITPGQSGKLTHPIYRSSSCLDLYQVEKSSKKRLFAEDHNGSLSSSYSSLQKSKSNMTTLERKESKSPNPNQSHAKKVSKRLTPDQLKTQLEQKILLEHQQNLKIKDKPPKNEVEVQRTENKYQKFGIKVLPLDNQQRSPKSVEQNENNINIEKKSVVEPMGIDEVDEVKKEPPPVKKREKKTEESPQKTEQFERHNLNGSGIKRDKNGIPQELPTHMYNAAVAVKRNRKNSDDREIHPEEDSKTPRKKGKAPSPPDENKQTKLDVEETKHENTPKQKDDMSDSDLETDNQSSVNTIELNSSDITIHQTEEEERQNRKTVSTGDLTKIKRTRRNSNGTLERAQSLDISDSGISTLTKKRKGPEDDLMKSEEDIFGRVMSELNKEPRLSLILDGLNTFQRNRLKKSTEWGNLEDAILKLNQDDESIVSIEESISLDRYSLGEKAPEIDAVINKIKEIKRESLELDTVKTETKIQNEIWPPFNEQKPNKRQQILNIEATQLKPPSPITLRKVNNRINEPFEAKEINSYSTDLRQMKPNVPLKPPPVEITNNLNPPHVTSSKRQRVPDASCSITPPIDVLDAKDMLIQDEWNITENIINTSPPQSLNIDEELSTEEKTAIKPEEVLSKIPLLNSMVKNQREESLNKPVISTNNTDETKTVVTYNIKPAEPDISDVTQNFLYTEQLSCSQDYSYAFKHYDTNISDDIKVSRHSQSSLERQTIPKFDEAKSHVSNVNVVNGNELHSLELSVNDPSELYVTALDSMTSDYTENRNDNRINILTPDLIKNVTLAEAISTLNNDTTYNEAKLTVGTPNSCISVVENKFPTLTEPSNKSSDNEGSRGSHTLTYITEIQVTPQTSADIDILNQSRSNRNLDTEFENYVKTFESKLEHFENNIQDFDKNLEEFMKEELQSTTINEKIDENEIHKIREIAEEQLKKLPEMKFTTSSYESPSKLPEKRYSQIELLKTNFEKKSTKPDITKSRIPIATTTKTPPTSPERRDSRNLENETDKAILELMSSSVTSTPYTTSKYSNKPVNKNITVTSIRTNSKIPSGLPTLTGRPPIVPRKTEANENVVQVSTNGNVESSFKQWVFNPSNVSNVTVTQHKSDK